MAASQAKSITFDSNEDSEYSDEEKRPTVEQKSKRKKRRAPSTTKTRLDIISQPPDRAFINLYSDFRNILEPSRAERIRRKLESFKTMTLEYGSSLFSISYCSKCFFVFSHRQLQQVLEERKQIALTKAKAQKRQRPQHFGSYCELKLDELYEQISEMIKERIKENPQPERQVISTRFKTLLEFAAHNMYPAAGGIQKRVAFEVATFVEHILLKVDK